MAKKILLIDDEPAICFLTKLNLEHGGEYAVTVAYSGEEGLEQLKREPFDLVITDYKMPGMDGAAVVNAIKAEPSAATPVVVFSIYYDDKAVLTREALKKSDGIIHKPIDREQMIKVIQKALTKKPPAADSSRP